MFLFERLCCRWDEVLACKKPSDAMLSTHAQFTFLPTTSRDTLRSWLVSNQRASPWIYTMAFLGENQARYRPLCCS